MKEYEQLIAGDSISGEFEHNDISDSIYKKRKSDLSSLKKDLAFTEKYLDKSKDSALSPKS